MRLLRALLFFASALLMAASGVMFAGMAGFEPRNLGTLLEARGISIGIGKLLGAQRSGDGALRVVPAAPAPAEPPAIVPGFLVVTEQAPPHREPPPPPPPAPDPPAAEAPAAPAAKPPPAARSPAPRAEAPPAQPAPAPVPVAAAAPDAGRVGAYAGMGAWVDLYDYILRDSMDIPKAVEEMSRRGVKTLYLQTGRWNLTGDIHDPPGAAAFLDEAHGRGIRVVGWYLAGFGDTGRDVKRSEAVLAFRTPRGERFDGLAIDIEDLREVAGDTNRFAAGIVDYTRRLRAQVGNDVVIGGIVPDAKNNKRAPAKWAPFPWKVIGESYDVIMPMSYWSVTKKGDCNQQYDVGAYMTEVVNLTRELLGRDRPMHSIGGIANCITPQEAGGYVGAMKQLGQLGVSFYDYATTQSSPYRDQIWGHLASF